MIEAVKIDHAESPQSGIRKGASIIEEGGIVAFPTESFYGLGVAATDPSALQRLFQIKKRDPSLPILVLISSINELSRYAASIPPEALELARLFWPGGLTLVFEASQGLPSLLTAGTGKIGIRISGHPVAHALTLALTIPITGTSANISGERPCTTAEQVVQFFNGQLDLILDGGITKGTRPSTVLDVTSDPPLLIREGIIRAKEIIASGIYSRILPSTEGYGNT
jgi:L-threonylcarbamoyladenylate synthase